MQAGRGHVVAAVGEPGVGKSRLLYEFVRSDDCRGCRVLEVAGDSHAPGTPYLAVVEMLRKYFGVEDLDTKTEIQHRVTEGVTALSAQLRELVPVLLWLLGASRSDELFRDMSPEQLKGRIRDALKVLFVTESKRQSLIVVVEDLQWIDSATEAVLESLVQVLPAHHILLLVNYRPDYQDTWASHTPCTRLSLGPLLPGEADQLLDALLGESSLTALKSMLFARSGGNPLFIEECVRSMLETGVLVGERGAYRVEGSIDSIQIPPTMRALLSSRIDRLSPEAKQVLECAAVIGREFPLPLLQSVAGLEEDVLSEVLTSLQAAELIQQTQTFLTPSSRSSTP